MDYDKLKLLLKERYGVPAVVVKVSRLDWLRNAAGLLDPNYWRGTLRPRPVLDWYFHYPLSFWYALGIFGFGNCCINCFIA